MLAFALGGVEGAVASQSSFTRIVNSVSWPDANGLVDVVDDLDVVALVDLLVGVLVDRRAAAARS